MKLQTLALSIAVAAAGVTAGQAFAQDRDVTIHRARPDGALVTKHIRRSEDGFVHRTVRVERPDGSTVIRRSAGYGDNGYHNGFRHSYHNGYATPHRTVVIHRHYDPQRRVVVVNRHPVHHPRRVTIIRDEG